MRAVGHLESTRAHVKAYTVVGGLMDEDRRKMRDMIVAGGDSELQLVGSLWPGGPSRSWTWDCFRVPDGTSRFGEPAWALWLALGESTQTNTEPVRIVKVTNSEGLATWSSIFRSRYGYEGVYANRPRVSALSTQDVSLWLGLVEDEPVYSASVHRHFGGIGIGNLTGAADRRPEQCGYAAQFVSVLIGATARADDSYVTTVAGDVVYELVFEPMGFDSPGLLYQLASESDRAT